MVRMSRKAHCVTSGKTTAKETTFFTKPHFKYKNRAKLLRRYLHAVDNINQLHLDLSCKHLALLSKNKKNTSSKKKEENNFTHRKKACQVCVKFYRADDWYLRQTPC